MKKFGDYRDYLRPKGVQPVVIERTEKKCGHLVLSSWAKPVETVQ